MDSAEFIAAALDFVWLNSTRRDLEEKIQEAIKEFIDENCIPAEYVVPKIALDEYAKEWAEQNGYVKQD